MSKADPQTLQIQSDAGDAQQQERFAALVRDVALGRAAVAEWQDRFARYQQAVEPLRRELDMLQAEVVAGTADEAAKQRMRWLVGEIHRRRQLG